MAHPKDANLLENDTVERIWFYKNSCNDSVHPGHLIMVIPMILPALVPM
jgi:hypothetical protein